jgi:hypothetical protein
VGWEISFLSVPAHTAFSAKGVCILILRDLSLLKPFAYILYSRVVKKKKKDLHFLSLHRENLFILHGSVP